MIPVHIAEIADLIEPDWSDMDALTRGQIIQIARRIYEAGYRKAASADQTQTALFGVFEPGI